MGKTDRDHADVVLHLQMIQRVIERMAENSVRAKQWALITMVAFLTVFGALDLNAPVENPDAAASLFLAPLMIWLGFYLIDTYYIYLERSYRAKFDSIRELKNTNFEMDFQQNWREVFFALLSWPNMVFYYLLGFTYLAAFFMFVRFGATK